MKKIVLIISLISFSLLANAQSKMGDSSDGVKKAKNSKKYDFLITFVNGDTRSLSSTIDINYCMKTMFLEDKDNEEAIYPAETKHIEVTNKEGFVIKGMPQDSMWVFAMNDGPLKLSSTLPETNPKYAEWLKKGDDDLLPFNELTLERAVKDNSIAADYMEKYKKRSAVGRTFGYYVTPGLVFVGFLSGPDMFFYEDKSISIGEEAQTITNSAGTTLEKKHYVSISIFHIASMATFPIGLIYHRSAKKQIEKAIKSYNK